MLFSGYSLSSFRPQLGLFSLLSPPLLLHLGSCLLEPALHFCKSLPGMNGNGKECREFVFVDPLLSGWLWKHEIQRGHPPRPCHTACRWPRELAGAGVGSELTSGPHAGENPSAYKSTVTTARPAPFYCYFSEVTKIHSQIKTGILQTPRNICVNLDPLLIH